MSLPLQVPTQQGGKKAVTVSPYHRSKRLVSCGFPGDQLFHNGGKNLAIDANVHLVAVYRTGRTAAVASSITLHTLPPFLFAHMSRKLYRTARAGTLGKI